MTEGHISDQYKEGFPTELPEEISYGKKEEGLEISVLMEDG